MQDKKQQLEPDGTMDWFKTGKAVHRGCILSPCLFNLYAEYIMQKVGLDELQATIKIAERKMWFIMMKNPIHRNQPRVNAQNSPSKASTLYEP